MHRTARFFTVYAAVITFLLAPALLAQDIDRFKFYNGCEPINLAVLKEIIRPPDSGFVQPIPGVTLYLPKAEDYPTEQDITDLLERRLRIARLYSESTTKTLLTAVISPDGNAAVPGNLWTAKLSYLKLVHDPYFSEQYYILPTATYSSRHGIVPASDITDVLSRLMDNFLEDFLRVNAEACD